MTGIAGRLNWDDDSSYLEIIGSEGDKTVLVEGQGTVQNTARTCGPQLSCWREGSVSVAVYTTGSETENLAKLVATQYLSSPESLKSYHESTLSLALIDSDKGKVFLSVDLFARFPLYFCQDSSGIRFSSSSIALTKAVEAPIEGSIEGNSTTQINPQSVFHYLYFHMVPTPHSIYQNVQAVESSHIIEISKGQLSKQLIPGLADMRVNKASPNDSQRLRDRLAASVEKKRLNVRLRF